MNKDRKKRIMGMAIIVIFFGSTFVFIAFDALVNQSATVNTNQNNAGIPDNFVSDEMLNENIASQLYQRGYTIAEFHYYEGCCEDIAAAVKKLPAEFEYQIIVQQIKDAESGSQPWLYAKSVYGEANYTLSSINNLTKPMCGVLAKPPLECGISAIGNNS